MSATFAIALAIVRAITAPLAFALAVSVALCDAVGRAV